MADARLARFRRLLAAASRTEYYRPWLEKAGLDTPGHTAALPSIEEALSRLPPVELAFFLGNQARFRNPHGPWTAWARFHFPNGETPRTAVLMNGFRPSLHVRALPNGLGRLLAWSQPEALAGPLEKLCLVAAAVEAGQLSLRSLNRAVIVLTQLGKAGLGEQDREMLWQTFQVPVFEYLLGFANELLAWECDAHQGLHVLSSEAVFERRGTRLLCTSLVDLSYPVLRLATGVTASLEDGACACGEPGPRML
ncbi:MAG: hypothetical protein AAB225_26275 [Acidobacteriota bacterium]